MLLSPLVDESLVLDIVLEGMEVEDGRGNRTPGRVTVEPASNGVPVPGLEGNFKLEKPRGASTWCGRRR
eukprot:526400-Rhodomonas_salina.1